MANEIFNLYNATEKCISGFTHGLYSHFLPYTVIKDEVLMLIYVPVDDKRTKYIFCFIFAIILLRNNSHNFFFCLKVKMRLLLYL